MNVTNRPARRKNACGGFTRPDLLVLLTLAVCAASAVLPFVNDLQEGARRTVCQNNLRTVSMELSNYENARNMYPGYSNVLMLNNGKSYADPATGKKTGASFIVSILRNLDRPDMDAAWKTPAVAGEAAKTKATDYLEVLVCPSDAPEKKVGTPLSYAGNCGMEDWTGSETMPRDWPENGVLFDRFTGDPRVMAAGQKPVQMVLMSNAYISRADGLANTLLLAEN